MQKEVLKTKIRETQLTQRFGKEWETSTYDSAEIIYQFDPRGYKEKDFTRLEVSHNHSTAWLEIEIEEFKANSKGTLVRRSQSITIDRKHAERLIESLQKIVKELNYLDEEGNRVTPTEVTRSQMISLEEASEQAQQETRERTEQLMKETKIKKATE